MVMECGDTSSAQATGKRSMRDDIAYVTPGPLDGASSVPSAVSSDRPALAPRALEVQATPSTAATTNVQTISADAAIAIVTNIRCALESLQAEQNDVQDVHWKMFTGIWRSDHLTHKQTGERSVTRAAARVMKAAYARTIKPGQAIAVKLDEEDGDQSGYGFWIGKAVCTANVDTCLFKVPDSFTDDLTGTKFKRGMLVVMVQLYERVSPTSPLVFKLKARKMVIDIDSIVITSKPIELVTGTTRGTFKLESIIDDSE